MDKTPESALRDALARHDDPRVAARALLADADELVIPWRDTMHGYELEVLDRHQGGLAALTLLHLAVFTTGAMFDRDHVPSARACDEPRVNVLRQLWASSIEAGGESLALLRSGYANGALARWRLVREAEVLASLVVGGGSELAQLFLDHSSFRATQIRGDYQAWAEAVGEERLTDDEMRKIGQVRGRLLSQHPEWAGEYGWAHGAVKELSKPYRDQNKRGNRSRGPTFADIEAAIGQRPSKLFYALASQAVHVTLNREQLPGQPAPDAIDSAAVRLAQSLPVPTAALLCSWPASEPDGEYLAMAELVLALSELAEAAFARPPTDEHDTARSSS